MSDGGTRFRKHVRLPDYDYRQPGAYFITVCSHGRRAIFGRVVGYEMELNAFGAIVREEWIRNAIVRESVELDAFIVMPNHFHGILLVSATSSHDRPVAAEEATHRVAATSIPAGADRGPRRGSIGAIVGQFKSHSSRRINHVRGVKGISVWQRNYHEHIIRSDRSLERIRAYIEGNPARWNGDRYFVEDAVLG